MRDLKRTESAQRLARHVFDAAVFGRLPREGRIEEAASKDLPEGKRALSLRFTTY